MKKLRFRSLTMRIWTTFTAIILVIICSISLLYLFAFKRINENAKIQDLKAAHNMLKGINFSQPISFDELRNLKGSDNFIVNIAGGSTKITDVGKGHPQDFQGGQGGGHPEGPQQGMQYNIKDTRLWMAGFIKDTSLNEKQFEGTYNKKKFYFIVSSIQNGTSGNSYLVSSIPSMEDYTLIYMVIGIGVIFIAIGFLASKIVAGFISKPLKELEDYTVRIARKDWKEPIQVKSDDEIGRLAASMNHMQRELKHADEEEKMFLQSISHDLKTPVMVIMSHADAIIDGVYIDTVEKTAEIIRDEAVSLEKKIKQLLYLNTLDYVLENNSENTDIDLKELMLHIINRFEMVKSNIQWDLDLKSLKINGNQDKLQVAMENILENGLRYADEKISVTLKQEGSSALLEIYNDGPNIDEKHINHIFDNFYKDKTGNFGLGLAITKKIVDFYKGEIKAVNREKGVSFIIKYPL